MTWRYEEFQYCGIAYFDRSDAERETLRIKGQAEVSGQLGRQVILVSGGKTVLGDVEFVSLHGVFTGDEPIPVDVVAATPEIRGIENGHVILLSGSDDIATPLPCTVKREEGERSVKIWLRSHRLRA